MTYKTVIILTVMALVLTVSSASTGSLSVSPDLLDFGEVEICGNKELTLTIYNAGNEDLEVPDISVDNDCFSTDFEDEMIIEPDEEYELTVTFAPDEVGELEGTLIIISNDKDNEEIKVALYGVGIECEIVYSETVLFAQNSMWFKQGAEVLSGNIWVNTESEGPFLNSNCPLSIGTRVHIASDLELKANRIKVNPHAVIDADVAYNRLENRGTINGDLITPLALPISVMPDFPEFECGDELIEVPRNGNIELEADTYGHLRVERGGTVTFTGGVYTFRSINSRDYSNLIFLEESEIRVRDKFVTETSVYVGPAEEESMTAQDIVFYVEGRNGNNGRLGASPKSAAIGMNNNWQANIYVPNGTLWIRQGTTAEGSFIARDIIIGIRTSVEFNGGFEIPAAPEFSCGEGDPIVLSSPLPAPDKFELSSVYPNPFNSTTSIKYGLPYPSHISLEIYNPSGQRITTLFEGYKQAGFHTSSLIATDLPSGLYFVRLEAAGQVFTQKAMLIR